MVQILLAATYVTVLDGVTDASMKPFFPKED